MSVWLGIDPGTTQSGWALYRDGHVLDSGVMDNGELLGGLNLFGAQRLALEIMVASYSKSPVGKEVFDTVRFTGRLQQAWRDPEAVVLVPRGDVRVYLCGTAKSGDPHVRQALIDRLGAPGVKANKGPTYGVKSHAWAALGVAVTASDRPS